MKPNLFSVACPVFDFLFSVKDHKYLLNHLENVLKFFSDSIDIFWTWCGIQYFGVGNVHIFTYTELREGPVYSNKTFIISMVKH